ncbi:FAD/NAD(P)-binding domain-containing protein [Aspergillus carlsbadensis]|nr:FAD/NAD(P)-binding domain-containing protein [Aspergillus carlsbadensis]
MSIPGDCTVLVVGGGPGGSYTASVLAREGIDTVLLEAEKFPRYHIGESLLPSFRHYLRFIDLDEEFANYGFTKKPGAAFKINPSRREGVTDFVIDRGPDHYAWNVVRSEADDMLFRHAGKSGAKIFDGVKVTSVQFESVTTTSHATRDEETNSLGNEQGNAHSAQLNPGRPISASWTRKEDGATGVVRFKYIVDATGRAGLLSTKYLKNRHYSAALKNVANWAYYTDAGKYGDGTNLVNSPFFEALHDESGWAWFIPLHDGTTSVGVVRNQAIAAQKKSTAASLETYFDDSLTLAPMLSSLLGAASKRTTPINSASDYSYHASSYAFPNARVVGDAGCFIDPFFSSGVHLAVTGALSAATTIAAAIRGDVDEATAAQWHSGKVRAGYARWLLVVLSVYKQMIHQDEAVLSDFHEDNFDRAFAFFRPVIQGEADSTGKITQVEFAKTIEFVMKAFDPNIFREGVQAVPGQTEDEMNKAKMPAVELTAEDMAALRAIRMSHGQTTGSLEAFTTDVIHGRLPLLQRGALTLVLASG